MDDWQPIPKFGTTLVFVLALARDYERQHAAGGRLNLDQAPGLALVAMLITSAHVHGDLPKERCGLRTRLPAPARWSHPGHYRLMVSTGFRRRRASGSRRTHGPGSP